MSAVQQTSKRAAYRIELTPNSAMECGRSHGEDGAARRFLPRDLEPNGVAFFAMVLTAWLLLPIAAAGQSANLTGLNLTGIPTAPTATPGTNTNQIATTAFVMANSGTGASGTTTGTTPTTNMSAATVALPGFAPRTLAARAADIYNVRDYGALGTNSYTTLSAQFPSSATASLAAFASQSVGGVTPYSWMTNPAFGLTFSMPTSVDQGGAGRVLTFLESLSGINGWSATVATWQDPAHGNYLVQPGMQVTGSCIASGTVVSAVGRTPGAAGYGTVTLSQASSADCSSGASIGFTIAPSVLQTLTMDWLGIQGAMAAAWMNTQSGGSVYMPSGTYLINHSLINAGGVTDTSAETPNLDIRGDGTAVTRLSFPTDLGQDECAISEATRGSADTSLSTYHDFRVLGPWAQTVVLGAPPSGMDGLCIGATARVYGIRVSNMHAGLNGIKDHWSVRDSGFSNNGYGIYFAPYTSTMGNQTIEDGSLASNSIASIGIASTDQIDSSILMNLHTGFGPYGFYQEPKPSTVNNPIGMLTNSVLNSVYVEGIGDAWIFAAGGAGGVNGNTFIGETFFGIGGYSGFNISGTSIKAAIYAVEFDYNTMINTSWGSYGSVSDAIVEVSSDCVKNEWVNDVAFPFDATVTVPPLKCLNGMNRNVFETSLGNGTFRAASPALSAGQALAYTGNFTVEPFTDGQPFAGIAASPAGSTNAVGVIDFADAIQGVLKAVPSQTITAGQPVFATTGGVAGGLDNNDAIGAALFGSPAGTSSVWIALDPGMRGGAPGAATGLTATGTAQSNAYPITSATSQFTSVPSNSGVVLGATPIGNQIMIYNDGANNLKVYPPANEQIGANATNGSVIIGPGASAAFRRLSTNLWHE